MPIRNPFARRPGAPAQTDENARPAEETPSHPGFERVDTVGSKTSSALSIASSRRSNDNGEYKMSGMRPSPPPLSSFPVAPLSAEPAGAAPPWLSTRTLLSWQWQPPRWSFNWLIGGGTLRQKLQSSTTAASIFLYGFQHPCFSSRRGADVDRPQSQPSPVEKGEPSWPKKYLSRNSEENRGCLSADREHFTISRESFDSYRRSFVSPLRAFLPVNPCTSSPAQLDPC